MQPVTPLAILLGAKTLVERGWSRWFYAHDGQGQACAWWSQEAKTFCAIGALGRATQTLVGSTAIYTREYSQALHALELEAKSPVAEFNDKSEKKDVVQLFDRAILRVKGQK